MLVEERFEMQARYEYVSTGAATARLLSQWLAGRIHACRTYLARAAAQVRLWVDGRRDELARPDWSNVENADLGR